MWPFRNQYTPWELYAENERQDRIEFNSLYGMGVIKTPVVVDIYVRYHKKTRLPKYKYIEKPLLNKNL